MFSTSSKRECYSQGHRQLNPPSTKLQGPFHDTAINTIEHTTIENPGEIQAIQFSTNLSLKEADLPEYYSIIPATTNKKCYH